MSDSIPAVMLPPHALLHVIAAYSDPRRKYHNLEHIQNMFRNLSTYLSMERDNQEKPEIVHLTRWAIIFHDVFYIPGRYDNEEQSALYAAEVLRDIGYTERDIECVVRMVRDTKNHASSSCAQESGLLLDLDLLGLGASWDVYARNALSVFEEVAAFSPLNPEKWRKGRTEFLRSFLDRDQIFTREYFHLNYEHKARTNMASELSGLIDRPSHYNYPEVMRSL